MIPQLSVIIPIYNVERYLPQCLDSLINQTLQDIEFILVNDGSTDRSENICQKYAGKDSRIKVFSKPNGGLSDARNFGIKQATATIIGFVDSDDYIDLDMFDLLLKRKRQECAEIAVCGIKMVTNDGKEYQERVLNDKQTMQRHDAMMEILKSKRISNSVCNKIFEKTLFEGIKFPVGKLYEDEYVTYRLFDKAKIVAVTNKTFYYYRSSPNSITHKSFTKREFDRIYASQLKVKFIKENYPDLIQFAEQYLVYDCVMALSKMTEYSDSYNKLTRNNIRKYLKCFLIGDYSKGTKAFAVAAAISPKFAVELYSTVFKRR